MEIMKNIKEAGAEIEQGVESGLKKGKEVLSNVASHLPFANLAKKEEGDFSVEIDLPGVKKEDIDIHVDGNKLNISAVRKLKKEVKEEAFYMQESFYGKIARTFILPDDIDRDAVDATLEDGRLYIKLTKVAAAQPKKIAVN
jgi:HSP20 family protein